MSALDVLAVLGCSLAMSEVSTCDQSTPDRAIGMDWNRSKLLADLVRTDAHNHFQVAGDSGEVAALKITARAHQNSIWDRTRQMNRLRSDLGEFVPAVLAAFDDLTHPDALSVLSKASALRAAAALSISQIRALIK